FCHASRSHRDIPSFPTRRSSDLLDWSNTLPSANEKILADGYSFFTIFFMLMVLKGVLLSMAGPAPNYDMQRVLSAKTPVEAAKMSWFVNVVLIFPRYMLIDRKSVVVGKEDRI